VGLGVEAFFVKDGMLLLLNKQPFKFKSINCDLYLKNWSETDKLR